MKILNYTFEFDIATSVTTAVIVPCIYLALKKMKNFLATHLENMFNGLTYCITPIVGKVISSWFSVSRYCKLQLNLCNPYLYVPSNSDTRVHIDNIFVTLRLGNRDISDIDYTHNNLSTCGNRIIIIGDPGSGKSSLTKRLFRDQCKIGKAFPRKVKLPFLIELKNVSISSKAKDNYIGKWFYENIILDQTQNISVYNIKECIDAYAKTSGLLVLLDGLDEISSSDYPKLEEAIVGLSNYLSGLSENNTLILTTRTQFYQEVKGRYHDIFTEPLYIKPFSPSDIYEFLTRWPFNNDSDNKIVSIFRNLSDRPSLRELCSNPLILSMYVAEEQNSSIDTPPETRTEFYNKVTEELIYKRRLKQKHRPITHIKTKEKRQMILGKLAFEHLIDPTQPANCLKWEDALAVVQEIEKCNKGEAELLFREISKETGLVIEESPEQTFRFMHLTFCEYLAAYEAIQGREAGLDEVLAIHRSSGSEELSHSRNRLTEVIPFCLGLLPRVKRVETMRKVCDLSEHLLTSYCFLETKIYEDHLWTQHIENEQRSILKADEQEWSEDWLRRLYLLNTLINDYNKSISSSISEKEPADLENFYIELLHKHTNSLAKIISLYASQDAAAALRMVESTHLNLVDDLPKVIIDNCDQAPFLAMVIEQMTTDTEKADCWLCLITESALRHQVVARRLREMKMLTRTKIFHANPNWIDRLILPKSMTNSLYYQMITKVVSKNENYRRHKDNNPSTLCKHEIPFVNLLKNTETPAEIVKESMLLICIIDSVAVSIIIIMCKTLSLSIDFALKAGIGLGIASFAYIYLTLICLQAAYPFFININTIDRLHTIKNLGFFGSMIFYIYNSFLVMLWFIPSSFFRAFTKMEALRTHR